MDGANLSEVLGAALTDSRVNGASFDDFHQLLQSRQQGGPPDIDSLARLVAQIESDPDLAIFRGHMQVFPGRATSLSPTQLAAWLLERARSTSAEAAVIDLQRYLSSETLQFFWTFALKGIDVTERCELGHDLWLSPGADLPAEQVKEFRSTLQGVGFDSARAGAILRWSTAVQRLHVPILSLDPASFVPPDLQVAYDALFCLGLVGPCAPVVVASWSTAADWWPNFFSRGWFQPVRWRRDKPLTIRDMATARNYCDRFFGLNKKDRDRLRVPMERLNLALQRESRVDRVIDLGIALEALLLSDTGDDRGELSFRLQVRGAWFMGADREERATLAEELRGLYHLRSTAVHTGQLGEHHKGRSIDDWVGLGASLAARGIVKVLNEGFPSADRWRSLVVGA